MTATSRQRSIKYFVLPQRRQQTPVVAATAAGVTLQPSLYGTQPPTLPGRGGPQPSLRVAAPEGGGRQGGPTEEEREALAAIPEWALEADLELEKSNILLLVRESCIYGFSQSKGLVSHETRRSCCAILVAIKLASDQDG